MRNKRRIAMVTLLAFLVNVMLPFVASYNVSQALAAEPSGLESVFGEKILLCTAEGFKWVSLADLQSGKEKPAPHPQFKCPLCYVAASSTSHALPSDGAGLVNAPTHKQPNLSFVTATQIKLQRYTASCLTRAPPEPIIA